MPRRVVGFEVERRCLAGLTSPGVSRVILTVVTSILAARCRMAKGFIDGELLLPDRGS